MSMDDESDREQLAMTCPRLSEPAGSNPVFELGSDEICFE
jgi:hypothetical protein